MKNIIKTAAVIVFCMSITVLFAACGKSKKTDERPLVSVSVTSSIEGEKLSAVSNPYGYRSIGITYSNVREGDTVTITQPADTNGITLDSIKLDGEVITESTFIAEKDCTIEYCYVRKVYNVIYQNGVSQGQIQTIKVGEVPVNFETAINDDETEREYGMSFDKSWNIGGITKRLTATTVLDASDMLAMQFDGNNLTVTPHYSSYVLTVSSLRFDVSLGGTDTPSNYSVTNEQSTNMNGMYLYSKIATVGVNTIEVVRTAVNNVTPYYWAVGTTSQVTSPSAIESKIVGDYTYYCFTGKISGKDAVFAFVSDTANSISIAFVGLDAEYMMGFFETLQTIS
jgi:hypothetical protein